MGKTHEQPPDGIDGGDYAEHTMSAVRVEKVAEALFWDSGDDLDGWVVSIDTNDEALGDRGGFATIGAAIDWANKQASDRGLTLATGGLTLSMNRLVRIDGGA